MAIQSLPAILLRGGVIQMSNVSGNYDEKELVCGPTRLAY